MIQLKTWGLMNSLALGVALVGASHEARYRRVDPRVLLRMWPWVIASGVLGAHLYWWAAAAEGERSLGAFFRVIEGTAIQGGMIGGVLAALVFLRRRGLSVLGHLDVLAPGGALAHGIMRLGCFAAGCCYGKPTALPWGIAFSHPFSDAPRGVPLHPAQLYEAALDILLAGLLHRAVKDEKLPVGAVFWRYIGGYGVIRFVVQFFRDDDAGHLLWGLAHSQYMALAMLLLSCALLKRPLGRFPEIKNQ
ncbi:MAG: prolipoprotein diacylglyceryl transferase [Elusimicrobia bacterium]|nr:prolipoprotein diacylglyceryl transferase [Elusimicrobiota bacterium]